MLRVSNIRSLFHMILLFVVFISGCSGGGGGGGGSATLNPCPDNAPALGPTNGEGGLLFFTGCGLWAVDPAKPDSSAQIAPHLIPGSLQKIANGTWNTSAQKVTDKHLHALIYARGEDKDGKENPIPPEQFFSDEKLLPGDEFTNGSFYKISALKGQSQSPVKVSNESRANKMCGVIAVLEDYQNIDNSLYVYSMPGPDDSCTIADDNVEKIIKPSMGENDPPITLPRGRDAFTLSELVDKNTGAITGWLAIKTRRQQRRLPDYTTQADASKDVLKPHKAGDPSRRYPLGFFTGTPVLVSGLAAVGGLNTDTSYFINPDNPADVTFPCPTGKNEVEVHFPTTADPEFRADSDLFDKNLKDFEQNAFNLKLKKRTKKICLADGAVLNIRFDADNAELAALENQIAGRRVVKAIVIEEAVDLTASGDVTLNTQASYIALHRCDIKMIDCGSALKETTFTAFCAESGFDQFGNEGEWLSDPFVVGAYDAFKNPVSGELTQWNRKDDDEFDADDQYTTDASGHVFVKTQMGGDDETPGWNVWEVKISGIGSPLTFSASKPDDDNDGVDNVKDLCSNTPLGTPVNPTNGCPDGPDDKRKLKDFTPPYCKQREEFYMRGVFPQSTRGSKAAFTGKMVVRIDLLYKPYWNLEDNEDDDDETKKKNAEKRNKAGTQGVLYVYDIENKTFTVDVPYKTNDVSVGNLINASLLKYISAHEIFEGARTAFPNGMKFVYDNDMYYFSDFGKIHRMPLEGNGKAVQMVDEGSRKILDMKLTTNNLVYTPVNTDAKPTISAVKSIPKGGGGAIVLHPDTDKTMLNLVTKPEWHYVYFQTLRTDVDLPPGPFNPDSPDNPGVYSQIYAARADGSEATKETENATMAGQSETRVFSVLNCDATGLFTCKSTPTRVSTLVSILGMDSSDHLALGTLPGDIDAIFFQGHGEAMLGEGYVDSKITNVDIFYIQADQADSLIRQSVSTPRVPEANL